VKPRSHPTPQDKATPHHVTHAQRSVEARNKAREEEEEEVQCFTPVTSHTLNLVHLKEGHGHRDGDANGRTIVNVATAPESLTMQPHQGQGQQHVVVFHVARSS
jgi:hypothetical protein